MARKKFVWKQKIVKISEIQQTKLDELLDQGSFTSEADIFRQALDLIHRKLKPPYLEETAAGSIKKTKLEQEKEFRAIPDREYVEKHLEDIFIFTDEDQIDWVLFRKIGNFAGAVKLSEVKDWVRSAEPEFKYHSQTAGSYVETFESLLKDKDIRTVLQEQYGVAITI